MLFAFFWNRICNFAFKIPFMKFLKIIFPVIIAFNAFLFLWYSVGVSPPCVSGRGESGRALPFPVGPAVSCGMILAYNQAVKERGFPL